MAGMFGTTGANSAAAAPNAGKGPPPQVGMGPRKPFPMPGGSAPSPRPGAPSMGSSAGFGMAGPRPTPPPGGTKGPPPMAGTSPRLPPRGGAGMGMAGDVPSGVKGPPPQRAPGMGPGAGPIGGPTKQQQMQTLQSHLAGRPSPTPAGKMPAMTSNKGFAGLTSPPIR